MFDSHTNLETYTGKELRENKTYCIYGWKREETWLYIGSSTKGCSRLFTHKKIKRDIIQDHDMFYIWYFNVSKKQLLKLEVDLIVKLQPILCISGKNAEIIATKNKETRKRIEKRQKEREEVRRKKVETAEKLRVEKESCKVIYIKHKNVKKENHRALHTKERFQPEKQISACYSQFYIPHIKY